MSGAAEGPARGSRAGACSASWPGRGAGQTLADLGAEVIKVERPGAGDDTRDWGPPFIEDTDGGQTPPISIATNRGKRSIAVDFETQDGQRRSRDLARDADVVIENFKVGGLTKYGLDYAEPREAINPRLIYCSITGFGQDGPYATARRL